MPQRSFTSRFEWWQDVRYWGGFPMALALIPAGFWGIWYEITVYGKICFHMFWGIAALILAGVMIYFRTARMKRFKEIIGDQSASKFIARKAELAELVQHLPRSCRRTYKERLAAVTRRM